jgi:signal transduction histidine kinase
MLLFGQNLHISFFIILSLWWYLSSRKNKERNKLRLQEHIHAEELSEAKLKFFINISHEIRTPVTLITAPLQQLLKIDNDPIRHNLYEIIRRNSERLSNLINQMMDLRKIDKGQMHMQMQKNRSDKVHSKCSLSLRTASENKGYTIVIHTRRRIFIRVDRLFAFR